MPSFKVYEGCNFLRQRLVLAILNGENIRITKIRSKEDCPGLSEFEVSLLRLIEKIAEGTKFQLNETGTAIFFQPGLLQGGKFEHECNKSRGIGYYLELIVALAPFCRMPVEATMTGITNDQQDPSVDAFKFGTLPVLKSFLGNGEGLDLKIHTRGLPPKGGGRIVFTCPIRKQLRATQLTDPGKIKRIRGMAFATRMSTGTTGRLVETAKGVLLKFLPDVFISEDHCSGARGGSSPGFGMVLVAETTSGAVLTAEVCSNSSGQTVSVPEELGKRAANLLLEEIYRGGCVDSNNQSLTCIMMAHGQQDVSKVLIGPMSPYTIQFLRHLRDFQGRKFVLDVQEEDSEQRCGTERILLTYLGAGHTNLSRVVN